MDYLEFFAEEEAAEPQLQPALEDVAVSGSEAANRQQQLVAVSGHQKKTPKRGKTFFFSRGTGIERKAWNQNMLLRRAQKKYIKNEADVLAFLQTIQKKSSRTPAMRLKTTKKGNLFSSKGLVKLAQCKVSSKGNRFSMKFSLHEFLTVSFGQDLTKGKRIQQRNATALAFNMSPQTVSCMRAVAFGATMARQANLLARLYLMCKSLQPEVVCLREAWDETSQRITVNDDRGAFQIMVVKHTLLILWNTSGDKPCVVKLHVAT